MWRFDFLLHLLHLRNGKRWEQKRKAQRTKAWIGAGQYSFIFLWMHFCLCNLTVDLEGSSLSRSLTLCAMPLQKGCRTHRWETASCRILYGFICPWKALDFQSRVLMTFRHRFQKIADCSRQDSCHRSEPFWTPLFIQVNQSYYFVSVVAITEKV